MKNKKLLAYRKNDGLGDWIMAMSVLKMVNLQYPNIDIHVYADRGERTGNLRQSRYINRIYDIIDNMDAELTRVLHAIPSEYDYYTKHMIYFEFRNEWHKLYPEEVPRDYIRNHLIHGMVKNFNEETKLDLKYDENVLARYKNIVPFGGQKPYIVMPSCGRNDNNNSNANKSWGTDNYKELARRLKDHYYIVQIGSDDQPIIKDADQIIFDQSFSEVLGVMEGAEFYVGEINGLVHLAGHHGIKTYAIYCGGKEHPDFTGYKNQIPIMENNASVDTVYSKIIEDKNKNASTQTLDYSGRGESPNYK